MMPSLVGTNMVGLPHHQASGGAYTVDTLLNELSRQLIGNTRRYSRASNTQHQHQHQHQRGGSVMRISKPGSANNSPRSSTLQARRRTLVGDAFRPGLQTQSPAMDELYLPQLAPETQNESFYERQTTRPARPVSWHPSSQNAQQSLYAQQQDAISYPYSMYSDTEVLASLQHFPPTPAVYSGYASPAESFSPLSLPYSNFGSSQQQQIYSPMSLAVPTPQQQPQQVAPTFPPATCSSDYPAAAALSDIPYIPLPRAADDTLAWESPLANTSMFSQQTAPPTPEDFAYGRQQQEQPQQSAKSEPTQQQQTYQPLIIHDDENDADPDEGEILYGMGLYDDAPAHGKQESAAALHHQTVVLSLLGGVRDHKEEEVVDTGKGLGLKLEDAWEPPASEDEEDEEEDEEEGDDDDDGEGQDD